MKQLANAKNDGTDDRTPSHFRSIHGQKALATSTTLTHGNAQGGVCRCSSNHEPQQQIFPHCAGHTQMQPLHGKPWPHLSAQSNNVLKCPNPLSIPRTAWPGHGTQCQRGRAARMHDACAGLSRHPQRKTSHAVWGRRLRLHGGRRGRGGGEEEREAAQRSSSCTHVKFPTPVLPDTAGPPGQGSGSCLPR